MEKETLEWHHPNLNLSHQGDDPLEVMPQDHEMKNEKGQRAKTSRRSTITQMILLWMTSSTTRPNTNDELHKHTLEPDKNIWFTISPSRATTYRWRFIPMCSSTSTMGEFLQQQSTSSTASMLPTIHWWDKKEMKSECADKTISSYKKEKKNSSFDHWKVCMDSAFRGWRPDKTQVCCSMNDPDGFKTISCTTREFRWNPSTTTARWADSTFGCDMQPHFTCHVSQPHEPCTRRCTFGPNR